MALFPLSPPVAERTLRSRRAPGAWIQRLARLGYVAKGRVYTVVGGLAVQAAFNPIQHPHDSEGAFTKILRQPLGQVILAIVALGLAGYVLWRLVQAVLDPEGNGTDLKGGAARIGYLISAILHGALTFEAVRLLIRSAGAGQGREPTDWTAAVMAQPLGRWVIALVGAGVVTFGAYELYRAATAKLSKHLDLSAVEMRNRRKIIYLGRAGLAARGIVFGIVGWFLVRASFQVDAQEVQGLAGALRTLEEQPYGRWILSTVASGLIAYGLFLLVKAKYRRIRTAGAPSKHAPPGHAG